MNNTYILHNNLVVQSPLSVEPTILVALEQALVLVQERLQAFANEPDFAQKMAIAFGEKTEVDLLKTAWLSEDFSVIPQIAIRNAADINGANGAYGAFTNKIYLSWEFLQANQANPENLVGLLLEEIGHLVDSVLNNSDSAGDEGAIFSALVQGESLSSGQLQSLKAEDDHAVITLDGQAVEIEQQDFIGTAGNDNITGTAGDDFIQGLGGNDILNGLAGNDTLRGSGGDDRVTGGAGNDIVDGGDGNDNLGVWFDRETIEVDTYIGGAGTDRLAFTSGSSGLSLSYTDSNGTGTFSTGGTVQGVEQFDFQGGAGNDNINVSASSYAELRGGGGDDTLVGGTGNDVLYGEAGNDTIIGVNANSPNPGIGQRDNLSGGTGSDLFILGDVANIYYDDRNTSTNGSNDYAIITDFNPLEDKIQLKGSASDYRLETAIRVGTSTNIFVDKPGDEPDELIAVLENVSGLTSSSPAFVYVIPNSELQFSASNFSVNENGATVIPVVITRSGGNQGAVSVTLTSSNGTATAPADYNNAPVVVSFANGETSKTVNIPVINDSLQEGNETITLTLSNPTGGAVLGSQNTATLTIIDDDVLVPDYAGNSLSTARDISILNGTQNFSDYLDVVDKDDYYRFELLKNSTFDLTLNGLSADANVELLNSAGVVMASSIASGTSAETINQSLNAGVYYVRVYRQSGQTNYNLSVKGTPITTPFQINSVTPDTGSNAGQVTLTIRGNQFTNAATVSLIAPDNTTQTATNVIWQNDTTLIATFNLGGVSAGAYDVRVTDTAGTAIKNDIFKVNTTGQGQLEAYLSVTPRLRPWNIGEVTVTYRNTGNTDIPAPLFSITLLSDSKLAKFIGTDVSSFTKGIVGAVSGNGGGGGGGSLNLPSAIDLEAADTATFWGSGNQGDARTLSPGESGTYKIYFSPAPSLGFSGGGGGGGGQAVGVKPEQAVGGINFSLNVIPPGSSNNPINWNEIKDSNRPSTIPVDAWDVIYNNFITALGNTVDSYQKNLGENSNYLGQLGESTDDISQLLAFELQQANNSLGNGILASDIDAAAPTPGLSLTFGRTYPQQISSRFIVDDFGRGWTHNWDIVATTDTNGNVTITSGGAARFFEKRSDNSYRSQQGDYGTLKLESGVYRLEEQGGLVQGFRSDGQLEYVEDTNGNRITLGYSGTQLTSLTHSNGDKFTLTYNAQGRIDKLTDQAGRVTTYTYDATGENLLSVIAPEGTTNYTYQSSTSGAKAYALSQIIFPDSTRTFFEYDAQGRLVGQNLEGNAESTTYIYDSTGGVTVKDGTGASTKIWLNDQGQIARSQDALGRLTQFVYDDTGNLTRIIAPEDTISAFTYDLQGNLLASVDPLGQRVDFSYEPNFNNLATVRDQRGNLTAYSYTNTGNLSSISYVDGSTETFSYDATGNLTVSVNRRGQTIEYTYDNRGLLLSKKYPDGTNATFTYDNRGNLLTAIDADSSVSYTYDNADRLTKVVQNNGRFLELTYDAGGRRTKMVDQTGAVVNYFYDDAGRLSKLTNGSNETIIFCTI
ncbi:Calx-beta domain-containing protein [Nostoc sp. FACHB-190]|uniref:Calx-beta domain-containing protein n=1 Tax=Nostoc sp. FACHB-190 TaxID=2692838 RepID=UPI0016834E2B|nr:Calx-beta domain-containing protein [Nostoc sp. FACHB-190]MBD2302223.1 pre-peptidase C-terminal domain-containing protein [Nostoc sp. FACHB-190]